MGDLIWTEELTTSALSNMKHSTWAVISPPDMLRAIEHIEEKEGKISQEEFAQLGEEYGGTNAENFRGALEYLKLIKKNDKDEIYELTQEQDCFGFYSGIDLSRVIKDVGITNIQTLSILGHNFILYARESLPFCCHLMAPGTSKEFLKETLVDHYVFNQKLNTFKFENLVRYLIGFGIIEETDFGLVVKHAPPALTFYHITSAYFFLASNKVGKKVNAGDLQREVNNLLPNREEDHTVLGLQRFPLEGWGKHQAWMTSESFTRVLQVGLIDPLCISRILKTIAQNKENPSQDLARSTLKQLKRKFLDDVKIFKSEPVNMQEVLQEFELPNTIA